MPSHYFDPAPHVASEPRTVELVLADLTVSLKTDRGVFSTERIDPGTKLLLQEAPPPTNGGDLLDLGCGYGPVAVALALRAPAARIWAVDVNQRALELVATNAAAHALANITTVEPHAVPPDVAFNACYSNPPIRVGKATLHSILDRWVPRCAVTYLVVSKHLGSDSLAAWMGAERGWTVDRLMSRVGYRILSVKP